MLFIIVLFRIEFIVMLMLNVVIFKFEVILIVLGVNFFVNWIMYIWSFGILLKVKVFYIKMVIIVVILLFMVNVRVNKMIVRVEKMIVNVWIGFFLLVSLLL